MPTPTDPARLAVQAALERNIGKVFAREQRVRDGDPDGLRKLRIAARRVRSDLATFGPLLDPVWASGLGSDLKHLADQLGQARDREVVLVRLERGIAALPPGAPAEQTLTFLRSALAPALSDALARSRATLDSVHYLGLSDALRKAAIAPPTTDAADAADAADTAEGRCQDVLPALLGSALRRLAKRARRLTLDPPGTAIDPTSDEAWHAARIRAKRARYAAEACIPVFGEISAELAARLAEITRCLGEHQDASIAAEACLGLGALPGTPAPAALGLGLLHGVQRQAVLTARAHFVALWPGTTELAATHQHLMREGASSPT